MRRALTVALLLTFACSGGDPPLPDAGGAGVDGGGGGGSGTDADGATGGACSPQLAMPPDEGGAHIAECTPVTYGSKPPSSGTHYPSWPVFRVYDKPVPWGFLMHGMEHGVVVIAYNCADGCPTQVAAIKELVESVPKKSCGRPPVIVTPDPTLDVPFAAAAWGHTLRATCFERQPFAAFIIDHANRAPENFPSDCGTLDREAAGWCP
jgi:hypothetical protein